MNQQNISSPRLQELLRRRFPMLNLPSIQISEPKERIYLFIYLQIYFQYFGNQTKFFFKYFSLLIFVKRKNLSSVSISCELRNNKSKVTKNIIIFLTILEMTKYDGWTIKMIPMIVSMKVNHTLRAFILVHV